MGYDQKHFVRGKGFEVILTVPTTVGKMFGHGRFSVCFSLRLTTAMAGSSRTKF
jgi:hypothetical protein